MMRFELKMIQRRRGVGGERRLGSRKSWLVVAALPLTVILTSCGATPPLRIASAGSPNPIAATQVREAACWTNEQRTGGDNSMPRQYTDQPAMRIDQAKAYSGTLETNKGTIQVEFYPGDAPVTVNNFVCLAEDGYFNNTPFHRIVKGFVIQGGDPTGTGSGGPGYKFADEPVTKDYERGTLAMANAGPNTNGSQFFIVLDDLRGKLPKNYTIFGRVTGGMDVVDAIASTPTRTGRSGENSSPTEPVTLETVTISES
jgi:cyclophilin family peptidyl-prolyl cis-trans isomerase